MGRWQNKNTFNNIKSNTTLQVPSGPTAERWEYTNTDEAGENYFKIIL